MKKIISVFIVMVMMAVGAPMAFAADGQMEQGKSMKQDVPDSMHPPITEPAATTTTAAIVAVGAVVVGAFAYALSADGGTTPTTEHPAAH
jgi:hypothetical protein